LADVFRLKIHKVFPSRESKKLLPLSPITSVHSLFLAFFVSMLNVRSPMAAPFRVLYNVSLAVKTGSPATAPKHTDNAQSRKNDSMNFEWGILYND
jgi:hypothetical protein